MGMGRGGGGRRKEEGDERRGGGGKGRGEGGKGRGEERGEGGGGIGEKGRCCSSETFIERPTDMIPKPRFFLSFFFSNFLFTYSIEGFLKKKFITTHKTLEPSSPKQNVSCYLSIIYNRTFFHSEPRNYFIHFIFSIDRSINQSVTRIPNPFPLSHPPPKHHSHHQKTRNRDSITRRSHRWFVGWLIHRFDAQFSKDSGLKIDSCRGLCIFPMKYH